MNHNNLRYHPFILISTAILLFAAWLRLADIGADPFMADQERISTMALNLGREGKWDLLGIRVSVGSLKHSPLIVYLYALPFRLDNDPHIARIFTALVNIIAVALVHLVGTRYFGRIAGLLATFFYATNPLAVHASRFIWNPNLAAPLVMLFLLSTLRGYYEDKPISRLAHLPVLSLAGQCHPSLFLLAPVALLGWLHAWRYSLGSRKRILGHTCLSGLLALVLMTPWIIGLQQHLNTLEYIRPMATGITSDWQGIARTVFSALGGSFGVFAEDVPPLPSFAILTLVASAWLIALGISRKDRLPGLLAVLGFFLLPTTLIALHSQYMQRLTATLFSANGVELNWWIFTVMGNAALIQGAFWGGLLTHHTKHGRVSWLWKWSGLGLIQARYIRGITTLALITVSAILFRAHTQFDYRRDTGVHSLYVGQNTLDDSSDALRYGVNLALKNNQELMLIASDPPLQTLRCINCRNWEALMLTKENNIRVIWDDYGVPLPRKGAVLLGPFNYTARPFLFSTGKTIYNWFQVARLPSVDKFTPDLLPLQPVQFSNGTTVLGFLREISDSMPVPAKPWTVHLLWRVDTLSTDYYKLFVHIVDAHGTKYGQVDLPGILPGQQRPEEHVLSQLNFEVSEDLPASGPLFFRFGMYNDTVQAEVINTTGEQPDLLQFRGSNKPLSTFNHGLELDSLSTQHKLQQGSPLNITATWHTQSEATKTESLYLDWALKTRGYLPVANQITELLPLSNIDNIPGDQFITAHYVFRIPTDLAPGEYQLILRVNDQGFYSPEVLVTEPIIITPRYRNFNLPPMQHTLGAIFGEHIRLSGYDLTRSDNAITLGLHWEALGQITVDYKYFVHIWDGSELVAQADAMPDKYRYPTSWWAPHEIFSDEIAVELGDFSSDELTMTIGLYNPANGQRLPVTSATGLSLSTDWVTLQD